jgi:dihydropteroate synthase
MTQAAADALALDDKLSQRFIELDPGGYFLIYLNQAAQQICADHYTNVVNDRGLACDPETGEPLPCDRPLARSASAIFRGRTAKELCIEIFEKPTSCCVTRLDHAAYLGREFVRAELALLSEQDYVQD